MVKLAEWRGKEIFRRYGIALPRGRVVRSPEEALSLTESGDIPLPCVVKAQVLAGGRGKGGAVRFASSPAEAAEAARGILGMEFHGETVKELLLEEKLPIARELYLSLTLDRSARLPLLIASAHGGVEIESVAESDLLRLPIHPFAGLSSYEKRRVLRTLGLSGSTAKSVDGMLDRLWRAFQHEDAELIEVNPLAVVGEGVVALDAKVIIEDDATFRHPEYADIRDDRTPLEEVAREKGIAFVQLDGDIGVIANGAGLTMATLDVLQQFGGRPGVFLDLGGTDDPAKVTEAFLLMARAKPSAVFLNIFGGVTRCDTVARGLAAAIAQVPPAERFPLVARIRGNNEEEGIAILREAGITSLHELQESAQAAVAASKGARP
ncbi:MAG: ADP-forming succinate--CoA ligase subunit beta [Thermoplasmata archaeon]|nr:ADP-forming succinate--CoA ligase subunit beta [Thermoplasmata archaeon]MCI4342298.1 ADP-forming succinate--CoA ligase subunit beta [Thermoplasmata archaeon]